MSLPIFPIAVVCAAIDVAVALAALGVGFRGPADPRKSRTPSMVARAGLSALFAAAVESVCLVPFGLDLFGIVHVFYVALVVAIPAAVAVVFALRLPAVPAARALAAVGLVGAPVGLYATFWGPFDLREEHAAVPIEAGRAGASPVRIGVYADLQTPAIGPHETEAAERLLALEPDLIVMPGDFYQGLAGADGGLAPEMPAFRALLERLATVPGGLFLTLGNVDDPTEIEELVRGTGARLLVNEVARVRVRDRSLSLLGLELDVGSPPARHALRSFVEEGGAEDFRIVAAHLPDAALLLPASSRVDLVIAGHTHGGQVVVPGYGPPMTLTSVPRDSAAGGLSEVHGNALYVSRGVGLERNQAPRIRFWCPPEVSLLSLEE